mmetsp:Transcript_3207/g.13915  ORF Transcript_3207/g.13915 Transcript_3207/m.13915 type:complete len:312 (+) Transcript_3207:1674-2609(+)
MLDSTVLLISTRCFARSSLLGSEEVVRHLVLRPSQLRIDRPAKLIKLEEIPVHPLVNLHDRRLVPAPVAVIRRAEHRHHRLIVRPLVPVLHQLVRSGDQVQAVAVVELLRDVLTERVPRASRGDAPAAPVVGVGPQQVAHRAFVRHLLRPRELAYVLQRVQTGAQAAVRAEDLVLDSRRQGQVVEHVGDVLPHVRVAVLAQALVVEAVHLRDLPRLVVAADDGDAIGVANLERHHQRDRLDRVITSVYVVAQEEVVCVRRVSAKLEHLQQVVKLSVDVADDRHGRPHAVYVGLLADQTARALAQLQHLLLG